MKTFQAALFEHHNRKIALVRYNLSENPTQEEICNFIKFFSTNIFLKEDVVAMLITEKQIPKFFGKKEVIDHVAYLPWKSFKWKEYSLNQEAVF